MFARPHLVRVLLLSLASISFLRCGSPTSPPVGATTPTPTASPSPEPTPWVCPLGAGVGEEKALCDRTAADPALYGAVYAAIDNVMAEHPDLFERDGGSVYVSTENRLAYFTHVVDEINAMGGFCAYDDGLEIAVKRTNVFSEQYKIWWTCKNPPCSGRVAHDYNMYRTTCSPAWF